MNKGRCKTVQLTSANFTRATDCYSTAKMSTRSTKEQSEASCSFTTRESKENPLKRKRMGVLNEEPDPQAAETPAKRRRKETEQNRVKREKRHVKRQKTGSRSVRRIKTLKKAGSAEDQSEASCSNTTRESKENPLKRKRKDVLSKEPEPQPEKAPAKRRRKETEQNRVKREKRHVKRQKTGSRSVQRINHLKKAGPLSTVNQSEASCSVTTRGSKENPLKKKRIDVLNEEPDPQPEETPAKGKRAETEQSHANTEKRHVKRQKSGSHHVQRINHNPKAGPLSPENQSEASCSFTRESKENPLSRKSTDVLHEEPEPQPEEMPPKRKGTETEQNHVKREETHKTGWCSVQRVTLEKFNGSYILGELLGTGAFSSVYAGVRKSDGKKVAVKYVFKDSSEYITLPDDTHSLPLEAVLLQLVCKPPRCPYVIDLLKCFELSTSFIFILEWPEPCITLYRYCKSLPGKVPEAQAQTVMQKVVQAVRHCHDRGVFHGDIKLNNVLLNPGTLEVKLIDFGFGYIRKDTPYTEFGDTPISFPLHWITTDEDMTERATVRDLGLLLLALLGSKRPCLFGGSLVFPKEDLSEACYSLITWCLERDPKRRPTLEQILKHEWF